MDELDSMDDLWEDQEEAMEDALDGGSAWELGFMQGAELANDEMIESWDEGDY